MAAPAVLVGGLGAGARAPSWVPPCPTVATAEASEPVVGTFRWSARLVLGLWRGALTRVDGQTCRFTPSCSAYAVQAVRAHGAIPGATLAAERVLRAHHGADYPLCRTADGVYLLDPLSDHDAPFWRRPRRER